MAYYHVRVTRKSNRTDDSLELDLSKEELQERIVERFLKGEPFMCGGEPIPAEDVEQIRINVTDESSEKLLPKIRERRERESRESGLVALGISDEWYVTKEGTEVTRQFIRFPPTTTKQKPKEIEKALSKNIFIVHGRDDKPKLELARMLEKLGFNAIILSEQPNKGRTIIEKLEQETFDIGYAFVILTPDDSALPDELPIIPSTRPEMKRRARQNVILELGYFVGKIGRNRVCCLYKGDVELPSDIHGVLFKKFNASVEECYKGILEELSAAGYEIKL